MASNVSSFIHNVLISFVFAFKTASLMYRMNGFLDPSADNRSDWPIDSAWSTSWTSDVNVTPAIPNRGCIRPYADSTSNSQSWMHSTSHRNCASSKPFFGQIRMQLRLDRSSPGQSQRSRALSDVTVLLPIKDGSTLSQILAGMTS
jgi:hypothetical protein